MVGNPLQQKEKNVVTDVKHLIKFDYALMDSQNAVIQKFIKDNERTIRNLVELERLELLNLGLDVLALNKKLYNK